MSKHVSVAFKQETGDEPVACFFKREDATKWFKDNEEETSSEWATAWLVEMTLEEFIKLANER